jgi:hypothetical protein
MPRASGAGGGVRLLRLPRASARAAGRPCGPHGPGSQPGERHLR